MTEREVAVLALVGQGRTNSEIGATLFISRKTASVHVSNILRKLNVATRIQAATVADRAGLLARDDGTHGSTGGTPGAMVPTATVYESCVAILKTADTDANKELSEVFKGGDKAYARRNQVIHGLWIADTRGAARGRSDPVDSVTACRTLDS